jgi:hypothetical protein
VTPGRSAPFDAIAYNGIQINGSMEIAQEYGSAAVDVLNVGKYGCDVHLINHAHPTGKIVIQQQVTNSTLPGPPCSRLMGLEGLVSKHCERAYVAGRCTHWLKVKNPQHPAYRRVQDQF